MAQKKAEVAYNPNINVDTGKWWDDREFYFSSGVDAIITVVFNNELLLLL